jgi:hypothetical protein
LRTRNWMPARSVMRPISPSNVDLANEVALSEPPIAGSRHLADGRSGVTESCRLRSGSRRGRPHSPRARPQRR